MLYSTAQAEPNGGFCKHCFINARVIRVTNTTTAFPVVTPRILVNTMYIPTYRKKMRLTHPSIMATKSVTLAFTAVRSHIHTHTELTHCLNAHNKTYERKREQKQWSEDVFLRTVGESIRLHGVISENTEPFKVYS